MKDLIRRTLHFLHLSHAHLNCKRSFYYIDVPHHWKDEYIDVLPLYPFKIILGWTFITKSHDFVYSDTNHNKKEEEEEETTFLIVVIIIQNSVEC